MEDKNMKKIYCIFAFTALLAASCDFLKEDPTTSFSESVGVYDTPAKLEAGIRGIISTFHNGAMYTHDMQEFMSTASCLCYYPQGEVGKNNSNERYYTSYYYTQFSTMQQNNNMFRNHYLGINRCNTILDNLKTSPVDAEYKRQIEAEVKFYRAVLYFSLVRFYGDVPVHVSEVQSAAQADRSRSPYNEVYKLILDDLGNAWNGMRSAQQVLETTGLEVRPNKYAAKAFEAAVYVQIASYLDAPADHAFGTIKTGPQTPDFSNCGVKDADDAWKKALAAAETVFEGPYILEPKWSDLFRWTDQEDFLSDERIFVLPVTTSATGGQLARRSLPPYPEGTANTSISNNNYGRFRPTRFVFQKWAETYGGEKVLESGKMTAADGSKIDLEHYVSCPDPRFDATFIHTSTTNMNSGASWNLYPSKSGYENDDRKVMLPYFRKYLSPEYNGTAEGNYDFYYMRYAEVYLLAAEAAAALAEGIGDTYAVKAMGYIEELHHRARTSVTPAASQPTWADRVFADVEELKNAIWWERVFELYGEGHEWFDTHRMGAQWFIDNVIVPFNDHLEDPVNSVMLAWYGDESPFSEVYDDVKKGLFCAYPSDDLMYNRALAADDQNYYYWK